MAQSANSNSGLVKLPRWIVVILVGVVFAIFGFFLRDIYAQVRQNGRDIVVLKQAQAVTDARYVEIKEQLSDIKKLIQAERTKR